MSRAMFFYVFLFHIAFASAGHLNHTGDKRITYGYDTDIRDAKYYAFLWCRNVVCGATLVTTTRLITAAHCVYGCQAKDASFHMGMNSRKEMDQGQSDRYTVTAIHIHPRYPANGDWDANWDVAVLYVNGAVRVTDKVAPINYALSKPPLNDYIMCLGYGTTETGQGSERLQRSWFLTKRYDKNMIISNAEQTSVLPGDSGGPCVYGNQFVGDICMYSTIGGKTWENGAAMSAAPEILNFYRSHGL